MADFKRIINVVEEYDDGQIDEWTPDEQIADCCQEIPGADEGIAMVTRKLSAGEGVGGFFTVSGGDGDRIDFFITGPSGDMVLDAGRVEDKYGFSFKAKAAGFHTLVFDNSYTPYSTRINRIVVRLSAPGWQVEK